LIDNKIVHEYGFETKIHKIILIFLAAKLRFFQHVLMGNNTRVKIIYNDTKYYKIYFIPSLI